MSTVLVVDDDLDVLDLLDAQLTAAGFEVVCAVDAGGALAAVERRTPSCWTECCRTSAASTSAAGYEHARGSPGPPS